MTLSVLAHAGALLAVSHLGRTAAHELLPVATVEPELFEAELAADPPAPVPKESAGAPLGARARATTEGFKGSVPTARAKLAEPPAQPESATAVSNSVATSDGPRFAITLAPTVAALGKASSSAFTGSAQGTLTATVPAAAGAVDVPAKLQSGVAPRYPARALAAGVEANVPLEIVVHGRGEVTSARGVERVGYGLDEAAQSSVLAYRFTPALRGGVPVAVRMPWLVRFQLQ